MVAVTFPSAVERTGFVASTIAWEMTLCHK
jgi:hypothetical protein